MNRINIEKLSNRYQIRKMTLNDIEDIYTLCKKNTQYYRYCNKELSLDIIKQDLEITPPNIPYEQKYYVGFYDDHELIAIMDLIDGYPNYDTIFIGFFMLQMDKQGKGIGTSIMIELFQYFKEIGYDRCRLGIDKDNPQSNHFWNKQGFYIIKEVPQTDGIILLAEKRL